MKRYYVVTHGEAQHHLDQVVGGWFDSSLTPKGIKQAYALGSFFASAHLAKSVAIYSSDLLRCRETAAVLGGAMGLEVNYDQRLREMSFGEHEGMDQALHNTVMQASAATPCGRMDHAICPGAETRRQLAQRLSDFVRDLNAEVECNVFVTHGFAASLLISALQRVSVDSMAFVSFKMSPGSLSELVEDDVFKNITLIQLNVRV